MSIRKWALAGIVALSMIAVARYAVDTTTERRSSKTVLPVRARERIVRKIYRYSVIPGGVSTKTELRDALLRDSVASAHYAGFRLDQTRSERLAEPKRMFVSYRVGDQVYWTKRRMSLPQGEPVLSDGISVARGRCGNRLSETPMTPTSAAEPAAAEFEITEPDEWRESGTWKLSDDADSEVVPQEKIAQQETRSGDYLSNFGPQFLTATANSPGSGSFVGGSNGVGGGGAVGGIGGGGVVTSGPKPFTPGTAQPQLPLPVTPVVGGGVLPVLNPTATIQLPSLGPAIPFQTVSTVFPLLKTPPGAAVPGYPGAGTAPGKLPGLIERTTTGEAASVVVSPEIAPISFQPVPFHPVPLHSILYADLGAIAQNAVNPVDHEINSVQVPEPHTTTLMIFGGSLLLVGMSRRRRRLKGWPRQPFRYRL